MDVSLLTHSEFILGHLPPKQWVHVSPANPRPGQILTLIADNHLPPGTWHQPGGNWGLEGEQHLWGVCDPDHGWETGAGERLNLGGAFCMRSCCDVHSQVRILIIFRIFECKGIDMNVIEMVFLHYLQGDQKTGPHLSSFWRQHGVPA